MASSPSELRVTGVKAGYIWVGGHYEWRAGKYVWVAGHWEEPPGEGYVWIPLPTAQAPRQAAPG